MLTREQIKSHIECLPAYLRSKWRIDWKPNLVKLLRFIGAMEG